MLVLSRKLGEKIYIGENICITVVDIDRGKIRLGIEAPRDVPIYRQELLPLKNAEAGAPGTGYCGNGIRSCCSATVDPFSELLFGIKPFSGLVTEPVIRLLRALSRNTEVVRYWRGM